MKSNRAGSEAAPSDDTTLRQVFDDDFLRRLDLLVVATKRLFRGRERAERKTKKAGSGLEFADHRAYSPGDDLRYLDWNALMRLDQPLVRLFHEDEDLPLRLVLDVSDSMTTTGAAKLLQAKRLAAALAYVGLTNLDRVGVIAASREVHETLPAVRGKARFARILDFLTRVPQRGATDLKGAAQRIVAEAREPGLTIVLSDFYDAVDPFEGLRFLRFRRHEPVAVHVLHPDEADPRRLGLRGDVLLVDAEGSERREVTLEPALLAEFAARHERFRAALETRCRSSGIPYFEARTDAAFDDLILGMFRRGGLLR